MALLPDSHNPGAWFWRTASVYQKKPVSSSPAAYGIFRGVADWASTVLGRALTFKDLSRRPVVSALVDQMGTHRAARAVGMRPRTTENYHRAEDDDVRRQAAEVLREVKFYDIQGVFYQHFSQKRRKIVTAAKSIRMKPEPTDVPVIDVESSDSEVSKIYTLFSHTFHSLRRISMMNMDLVHHQSRSRTTGLCT